MGGRIFFFSAQSQMVTTCQPAEVRADSLLRSRAWLPWIFAFQKARRDFGRRKDGQFSCPCQKQPWTKMSNYPILTDSGRISAEEARIKAEAEYETFRKQQDLEYRSDFDEEVKRIQGNP